VPRADKANSFFNNLMVFVSLKIIWHCGLFTADGPRLHARVRARRELAAGRLQACASSSRLAASSASALRCSTSMLQTRMH